jgi:hypothetical protein
VSLAHLLFEKALLSETNTVEGKTFNITDPNPPIIFDDLYKLLETLSITHFKANRIPGLPLLLLAYLVEQYHILQAKVPKLLPALNDDLKNVQPALWAISAVHLVGTDAAARKSVEEGGLGYKGGCTTLEGLCMRLKLWNDEHAHDTDLNKSGISTEIKNIEVLPSAVRA